MNLFYLNSINNLKSEENGMVEQSIVLKLKIKHRKNNTLTPANAHSAPTNMPT